MKSTILLFLILGVSYAIATPIKVISDSGEKMCDYTGFSTSISSAEIRLNCDDVVVTPPIQPPVEPPPNSDVATETPSQFQKEWMNRYKYNPYSSKSKMQSYIKTGYQKVGGKEVYIINQSRNVTTIIPSCTNGHQYTFNGANCKINNPFKRNEIYSLRGRTKDVANYRGATITKDMGQLYAGNGESYKVVLSPYPGEMSPTRAGSFLGDCDVTAFGSLYMGLVESGVDPNNQYGQCQVPKNTNFYVNVELLNENSQNICDSKFCQFDIKLSGVQLPDL